MRPWSARGLFDRTRTSGSEAAANELAVRLGQQQAVAHLGQSALTDVSLQTVLDQACIAVATGLGADVAAVLELDPDGQTFTTRATVGWLPEEYEGTGIPTGKSHSGYTLTSNGSVILRDAETETRFTLSPMMVAKGLRSGLITKIGRNGATYGVIGAHTYLQRDFSEHDVTFLEAVANILSSAIRRRTAETAAEEALRVLEAVIEGTTDVVFINDRDGRFVTVNQRAVVMLGLPREEIVGRTLHELFPPDVADALAETDRRSLERGTVETFEERIRLGNDEQVYLTTKGPYRARDGTVLGTFGIARDITERAKRAEELARSEQRFRLAQEGARMGTWDVDLVSGVTTWSTGLHSIYGTDPASPTGLTHFSRLLHPDDVEPITRVFMDSYRTGADVETECRIIRPDGALRWLLMRSTSLRSDDGTPVRMLGVAADITERKLAEERLTRSEATLRLAQTAGQLGAWDWNLETDELHWTGGLYEIFELSPDSYRPSGKSLAEHIHPDDLDQVAADFQEALASASPHYESRGRIVRPSGEVRWVVNRGAIFRGDDGVAKRVVGITLDDTDRTRNEDKRTEMEARLRQAEKLEAIGQLAGGVAHDFNNLLVAISGYGELARRSLARGGTATAGHIDSILAASERAAALTKQLLAFGRRQVLSPELLDLNDVVRHATDLLERVIGDDFKLVTTLAASPVVVEADRGQLEQVVVNLAVNARDAMPGGGTVTISVGRHRMEDGERALLSVSDEGSGIDAETVSHIFEPFFTTKGNAGTGLGLATVHGIVTQSGGQIELDTELGRGSSFRVLLPLGAEEPAAPGTPAAAPDDGALGRQAADVPSRP